MDLTVVIPSYNGATTIGEQLDALVAEVWDGEFEVIVVENGPADGTADVVLRKAEGIGPSRAIRCARLPGAPGPSRARNYGVSLARAEKIAFCDADDIVEAGWVSAMVHALSEQEYVCGSFLFSRVNPRWTVEARPNLPSEVQESVPTTSWRPYAPAGNMGIRRRCFEMLGGFDEAFSNQEDTELGWRAAVHGVDVQAAKGAWLHYRLRTSFHDMYRQARGWSRWWVPLVKRYQPLGCPLELSSWRRELLWLTQEATRLPRALRSKALVGRWCMDMGRRRGRMLGMLHFATGAPTRISSSFRRVPSTPNVTRRGSRVSVVAS